MNSTMILASVTIALAFIMLIQNILHYVERRELCRLIAAKNAAEYRRLKDEKISDIKPSFSSPVERAKAIWHKKRG